MTTTSAAAQPGVSRPPYDAWERFAIWTAIGPAIHLACGYRHPVVRRGGRPTLAEQP